MAKEKPEHTAKSEQSPESPKTQSRAKNLKEYMSSEYGIILGVVVAVGAAVVFARTVSNMDAPSDDRITVSTERPQTEVAVESRIEEQLVPPTTTDSDSITSPDDRTKASTEQPQTEAAAETRTAQQAVPSATTGAGSISGMPGTASQQGRWVCSEWTYRPPTYAIPAMGGLPGTQ